MIKLVDVKTIEYKSGYTYKIRFEDGVWGEVDFSEYLDRGPVFKPLADLRFFRRAKVDGGTIAWPNGADIAPETLYERVLAANKGLRRTPRSRRR
jgi:hypothetical protein